MNEIVDFFHPSTNIFTGILYILAFLSFGLNYEKGQYIPLSVEKFLKIKFLIKVIAIGSLCLSVPVFIFSFIFLDIPENYKGTFIDYIAFIITIECLLCVIVLLIMIYLGKKHDLKFNFP